MKTWKKIVRILLLVAVIVPTAALVAVQIPSVQTALAGKATKILSKQLDGSVHVGKVYFSFPNNVILKDVEVIQGESDTLAHLGKVLINLKTSSLLLSDQARIRRVSIEDGQVAIRRLDDSTTNLSALIAPLRKDRADKEKTALPWESIRADRVTLKHIDVATDSLDVRDINLSVRDILYDKSLRARVENLSLREETRGVQLDRLGGDVALDSTGLYVNDFRFDDGHTSLNADVALGFNDFSDFKDFTNKVAIDAEVKNTRLDAETARGILGKDVPALGVWLDGKVSGTVSDLKSERLHIRTDSGKTDADLRFHIQGLPDTEYARIDAEILQGSTTAADLDELSAGLKPGAKKNTVSRYAAGETLSLKAKVAGTLSNLKIDGKLGTSSLGAAALDGTLRKTAAGMQIDGHVATETLQLGRILGKSQLGQLTGQTDLTFSTSRKGFAVDVETIRLDNFTFNGYNYHDIIATGFLNGKQGQIDLLSNDPNLRMDLHGDIDLGGKGKESRFLIDMDVDHADLDALHFDKRDSSALSLALNADLVRTPDGAILGKADIRGLTATLQDQVFDIGDLALESSQEDDRFFTTLESTVARAEYEGNIFVSDFIAQVSHLVMEDNLEHLIGKGHGRTADLSHPEHFGSLRLQTLSMAPLLDFFMPGIYVSQRSSIGIDLIDNEVQGGLSSELLSYGNIFLHNTQLRVHTEGERMLADMDIDRVQSGSLIADNVTLDATADSTLLDLKAGFRNDDGSGNSGQFHTQLAFLDPSREGYKLRADILPSNLTVAGHPWQLSPSTVFYKDKHIRIDDFSLYNGSQSLQANGVVGAALSDTVRVTLNDFDLGFANSFLSRDLDLKGRLTGQGEAFALLGEQKGILLDVQGKELAAAGAELGDMQLGSNWDDRNKRFNFQLSNTLDGRHPVLAKASFHPSDKNLGLDLLLDSLSMRLVQPLLSSLVSDVDGSVSGHIRAEGPLKKLALESENTRFNKLKFKLLYTQVDYEADGPFTVGSNGVIFNDIALHDNFGHEARLNGGVPYDHFKDLRLDARINLENIQVLNTTSRHNNTFYGQAFADGSVRLSGPLDKVRLSLNLTPRQNTTIHIPLSKSGKESQSLLTFINNEQKQIGLYDSLLLAKQMVKQKKKGKETDLSVNLRLNATPEAEIQIEVDKNTGDILKARGNGRINITAGNNSSFDIKGDYRVDSGSYHFGMLGFTARDFSINPGGTIGFTGDVMQSDLDLTATYRTKASISPLIADSTAVSTRRTVDCGIRVSGKLANPEIKFNIDIPDLDPTTKSRVESALNTEDKRMKQALALLVSGGFVPDEQSGIVNSTTLLYSNASEMMASQLNNIFRQLDIPIDLGFNYQPTETGRDIFDVAVSTQLFNNRVIINGNIGNRQYISSSTSDIVGDIDIEIKLNRQGQVRLTLFSHSADQYSNYLDLSQRNGAGIVYQEDFNTIGELWRKIFHLKSNDERPASPDTYPARRPRPE